MSDLNSYAVGILLRFDAEGEAHALDQFVDSVLGPSPDPEAEESLRAWVNMIEKVAGNVSLHCPAGHIWEGWGIIDESGFTTDEEDEMICPECGLEAEGMA